MVRKRVEKLRKGSICAVRLGRELLEAAEEDLAAAVGELAKLGPHHLRLNIFKANMKYFLYIIMLDTIPISYRHIIYTICKYLCILI